MRLFLLRHAEAAPGVPDAGRLLTDRGKAQVAKMARRLDWSCLDAVKSIEHSGLVRARQTAELLAAEVPLRKPLAINAAIRPMDDPRLFAQELAAARADRLLVGHNPHLSRLAGLLLGRGQGEVSLVLKKAAFLALERSKPPGKESPMGHWSLLWLIPQGRLVDPLPPS
ncbi:MAG: SixA phosphatase family protein [Opitutia bacterium]|jgi:phosphohistidine phosphatase